MFCVFRELDMWGAIAALPVSAWEMSLAVWLIVKGFKPSPSPLAIVDLWGSTSVPRPVLQLRVSLFANHRSVLERTRPTPLSSRDAEGRWLIL
jgi:hypothetical protein